MCVTAAFPHAEDHVPVFDFDYCMSPQPLSPPVDYSGVLCTALDVARGLTHLHAGEYFGTYGDVFGSYSSCIDLFIYLK